MKRAEFDEARIPGSVRDRQAGTGFRAGVRESMTVLPACLQPLLTYITGKPLADERPSFAPAPMPNFVMSLAALLGLMAGNLYLLAQASIFGFLILPLTWVICTGLLRKMQVVFGHHSVHRTFIPSNPAANELMLNILVTIPLAQNSEEYRHDHFGHHSRALFTTLKDADAAFLHTLGFAPGASKAALWHTLFKVLVLPRLHWLFLLARMRSNFITRPPLWRLLAAAWLGFLTVGLCLLTAWWHVALVVWLPFFIFYHISALLQFLTEHAWMISRDAPESTEAYAERCWGRFLGAPCPPRADGARLQLLPWIQWWAGMILVHAPMRLGCLVGDLPAHDWHHLCGFLRQAPALWPTAIFARQSAIDGGNSMGMERRELWGMHSMLEHVFSALEATAPDMAYRECATPAKLNDAARDAKCPQCQGMTFFRCRKHAGELESALYFCICRQTREPAFDPS